MRRVRDGWFALGLALCLGGCTDGEEPMGAPDSSVPAPEASVMVPEVDTDGDGLSDAREMELGTDRMNPDTDGDGYLDFDEVVEGSDPLDPMSWIYLGHWPYLRDKDAIEDPGWESTVGEGVRFPRYRAVDQHGQMVDLYDFARQGRPIVIDVGTWFCEPCKAMAEWFATGDTAAVEEYAWWDESYEPIRGMVERGEIFWITVLYSLGSPVTAEDVARWDETFPNEHIPVLADSDLALQMWMEVMAMPRIDILDEEMNVTLFAPRGPQNGLRHLVAPAGE